jgi:branched-chain amino acid transport system substrate-binding protein
MKIKCLHVALAALALAVGGCGSASNDSSAAGGGDTVVLGYTATLSGDFASYGLEMRQGVDLAVAQLNANGGIDGKQVTVRSEDDAGKPSNGPVVAQKLCDDDSVSAVLGYSFSSVALAAVPVYTQCTLPVVASAVTSPELSGSGPTFFRNVLTDAYQGKAMGEYAVGKLGLKRIAVLNQKDDYGVGTSDAFIKAAQAAGAEIVSRDAYQLGTTDYHTQLSKVKRVDPDAIYIGGFYAEAAKIALQARSLGLDQPLLGTDGSLSPDLLKLGKDAVDGMVLYGVFSPDVENAYDEGKEFVTDFKARYDQEPTSWAALAYDAVNLVAAAAEKGGGTSRAQIQDGLEALKAEPGVTGPTTFTSEGDRVGRVLFLEVADGRFVLADQQ